MSLRLPAPARLLLVPERGAIQEIGGMFTTMSSSARCAAMVVYSAHSV
jgi:hypothetical protein